VAGLSALDAAAREEVAALAAEGLPGAVLGTDAPDGALRLALGTADLATGAPLRLDHRFRVGSVSKLVVGGVVRALAAAGALDLRAPIAQYRAGVPDGGRITLAMLGAHRSGLRDALEDPAFRARINADPAGPVALDVVLAGSLALPPRFAPGDGEAYANVNAILLAEAAACAAGEPYASLARRLVLEPAGADLAPMGAPPSDTPRGYRFGRAPGRIEYGTTFFEATRFDPSWAGPAGDLAGRLEDVLRLGRWLARAPTAAGSFDLLTRRWPNGLGGHSGDVPGYSACLAWTAGGSVLAACANLSNLRDGANPAERIVLRLVAAA